MHGILRAMKAVRFVTYGCKANQYDTQVLREALARRGWSETGSDAELVVINTCTVTAEAGRKARQLIRRLGRQKPNVRIAVTGCLAESEPEVLRELPAGDLVTVHLRAEVTSEGEVSLHGEPLRVEVSA
jgi:threonylcarbamoyladenosine tRNA methylthiotransferase MtaB